MIRNGFFILAIVAILTAAACAQPSVRRQAAAEKVASAEQAVAQGQHAAITHGTGNTLAAAAALAEDPSPSPATQLAADRLQAARIAFETGQALPDAKTALELEAAAAGALGTNDQIRAAALQLFDAYDRQLIARDQELQRLRDQLSGREDKLERIDQTNATTADKWAGLMSWLRWIAIAAGAYVIARVAAIVISVTGTVNPAISAGSAIVQSSGKAFAGAFRDLYEGGSRFLSTVASAPDIDDEIRDWIRKAFHSSQDAAQDRTTKDLVSAVKRPPANTIPGKPITVRPS